MDDDDRKEKMQKLMPLPMRIGQQSLFGKEETAPKPHEPNKVVYCTAYAGGDLVPPFSEFYLQGWCEGARSSSAFYPGVTVHAKHRRQGKIGDAQAGDDYGAPRGILACAARSGAYQIMACSGAGAGMSAAPRRFRRCRPWRAAQPRRERDGRWLAINLCHRKQNHSHGKPIESWQRDGLALPS
ncbi:hypothetical protein OsI_12580 [Oryza sativa Indica Group]|uniref:Uncharacterized protein n=1 Tax=Oryza sativa subsp. indica TaxID=39946 RepID=B8AM70_ORYSI|nr:hypothetical protein OsI_12580 [Oryza sativa Indica Group]